MRPGTLLLLSAAITIQHTPANAQTRAPYDRAKYYTKAASAPFTFTSRYVLTADKGPSIKIDATEAEFSDGRIANIQRTFNPSTDAMPVTESAKLLERGTGKITTYYWSKWQQSLGKPMLVSYGVTPSLIHGHTLPENNCTSPEPAIKFVGYEALNIAGQEFPAAVIETKEDDGAILTAWDAMSPGLGCLELKSTVTYTTPENVHATTVHDPVSLVLGEPHLAELDIPGRIAQGPVQVIPISSWNATVTATTNRYKAEASAQAPAAFSR